MPYERELAAARRWVEETDRIALASFRIGVPTDTKADGTPVTAGDRAVEAFLRRALAAEFPADGVLGEEEGQAGSGTRRWIIDPIDGTKNYARGVPVFATLIGLEEAGRMVLGVVSAPALRTRWWATRGGGAFRDGEPIRVSATATLAGADLITGGIDWAARRDGGRGLLAVCTTARRQRGFGDFWGHMLVAQGSAEAMIEYAPLAPWDVAACKAIVEEAGGRMSGIDGADRLEGDMVSSNGALHDTILRTLQGG